MTKKEAKMVAEAIIGRSIEGLMQESLDSCDELISEKEKEKIYNEMKIIADKFLDKFPFIVASSTEEIVEQLLYE